ncbi:hypothetical protein [Micromonospora sp. WMMD1082]|uniref:hypothetical protein n=1 Tax=Micromonospora sp. WMMD1082 TaxID=3016104 RepID=UPI0024169B0F|nr:hypothetical protein [Micromonospora sp. WMMD1082]MDG4795083.1 hypothetical protein [Micromonospora sp. WMMD1082]
MPWNHMQVTIEPADSLIRPMIGPGGLTREQAIGQVQSILDRHPHLATTAGAWRRGAHDDTVYYGPLVWTVYEYPEGEDPRRAALVWLEEYAATMRGAGVDLQVARLP